MRGNDANGNNTQIKIGNQPLAEYTYDAKGNKTTIEYGCGDYTHFTYDSEVYITAVYETATPEALLARYAYDEANQLVREDNAQLSKTVTYTYDKGGNIAAKTEYPYTLSAPGTATDTIQQRIWNGLWIII